MNDEEAAESSSCCFALSSFLLLLSAGEDGFCCSAKNIFSWCNSRDDTGGTDVGFVVVVFGRGGELLVPTITFVVFDDGVNAFVVGGGVIDTKASKKNATTRRINGNVNVDDDDIVLFDACRTPTTKVMVVTIFADTPKGTRKRGTSMISLLSSKNTVLY